MDLGRIRVRSIYSIVSAYEPILPCNSFLFSSLIMQSYGLYPNRHFIIYILENIERYYIMRG